MRHTIAAGIAVAIIGAISMAFAPASQANISNVDFQTLFAPFPTPAANSVRVPSRPLLARETAVLTREGISPARASQAIDVARAAAQTGLVRKLEAAMASAYGGVWLEPATAQLHVGVTSPASRRTAESVAARVGLAADVVETPVPSTWDQLVAAQRRWHRRLASLFAHADAETAITPQYNSVFVTLSSSVPASERSALKREAAGAGINTLVVVARSAHLRLRRDAKETKCNLFAAGKAYCDKPITAGVTIESEANGKTQICTAGPAVIPRGEKSKTYLLTAGHCIEKAGGLSVKWYAYNTKAEKKEIGVAVGFFNGATGDFGAINVNQPGEWAEAGNTPVFALTAEWKKGVEKSFPVKGVEAPPMVGNPNCVEGQTSGGTCGKVKMLKVELEGTKELVQDEGEATSAEGDSGGPVIVETKGEYLVEGTDVGHIGVNAVFEPIETTLKGFEPELELLTTANEVRPAGEWDVNGKALVGSAALLSSALVLAHGSLEVVGAGVKIECTAKEIGISSGELVAPNELRAKDLTFTKCAATSPCSLASEAILTLPLHGLAQLEGTLNTRLTVLPLPSKTFAVLHFEGATCALLGLQPITGTADLLIHKGADAEVLHLVLAFSLSGSLKVGSSEGNLSGLDSDLRLASGQTWNFL